ncbi:MAG: malto-oligosyltrehalose trehalohydrolase [Nitrospiraceae bacterium]|nr:malto-oligosyltrehalose trehalohydrolase [Nitrospiraceae bacterium]
MWSLTLGATLLDSSTVQFRVWAPHARTVAVKLMDGSREPIPMPPSQLGYYEVTVKGLHAGMRYRYILDGGKERPDPASRLQPDGVHGPSVIVDPSLFQWSDQHWTGVPFDRLIIYELHVGTFGKEGTFRGIIPHLDYLRETVGITAVELMPVAQFPGSHNWGYDGVCLFAPQSTYGGVEGLKELVDACHTRGLAVILDVVYNHVGPEGNYLQDFGPYFTDHYQTPWGRAVNYDGADSDEVRQFVISNAVYWVNEYHVDALRLDAVHGIYDFSARHILRELAEAVHEEGKRLGRPIWVIGESDLNDVRVIAPPSEGGHGLDGQWSDDCHHALHTVLTGERLGYYEDFGRLDQIATALQDGFVYSGIRSSHRRRRHGNSARQRPPAQLVVCSQNHDQIGNRAFGDRLSTLVPPAALKVAAATVLLAPQTPLLFMGEEYGETAPFLYFIDHGDPSLVEAVRQGRKKEFAASGWTDVPDPQDPATFERSRVHPGGPKDTGQAALLRWYRALIDLRKTVPALGPADTDGYGISAWPYEPQQVLVVHRWTTERKAALLILGFNKTVMDVGLSKPEGNWTPALSSEGQEFGGNGRSFESTLSITASHDVRIRIPAYGVAVYTKGEG